MEISGILTKQGHKMKTWRRRHFELQNNRLCYYSYDGGPLKGEYIIDINTSLQISTLRRHGFSLVQQNGRTLNMYADNAIDKERWMNCLQKIINKIKSTHEISLTLLGTNTTIESTGNSPKIGNNKKGDNGFNLIPSSPSLIPPPPPQTLTPDSPRRKDHNSISTISIHIIQARDLTAKGSTNTYAKVMVEADSISTKIVKKELNPIWDEKFNFLWTSDIRYVRIEVWDDDIMHSSRDNFLGVVYIPIFSLQLKLQTPQWYKLGKRSSRSHVTGEIKVCITSTRSCDPNITRLLKEVHNIPELQTIATDFSSTLNYENNEEKKLVEDLKPFPCLFPPIETEFIEDLSLRVTLKPTLEKNSVGSSGLFFLTNYRIIFVSHTRIAFAEESKPDMILNQIQSELTCSIPLPMITYINIQAYYDSNTGQYEDTITLITNDSKIFSFIFHGSRSQLEGNKFNDIGSNNNNNNNHGKRILSLDSSFPNFGRSNIDDSSHHQKACVMDRSFSTATFNLGFLSQSRHQISYIDKYYGDELNYLESLSSYEGPPSQRIFTRIQWKVINRLVEIYLYKKLHHDIIRIIQYHEEDILLRPAESLIHSIVGDDETILSPPLLSDITDDNNYNEIKNGGSNDNNDNNNNNISNEISNISNLYQSLVHLPIKLRASLSHSLINGWNIYDPLKEYSRLGIPDALWRITRINNNYELCSTYPSLLVIPESIDDERLTHVALFRSRGRIPVLSWRHPYNYCSLTRCSQPLVGLGQNRSHADEILLESINQAGSYPGVDMINLTNASQQSLLLKPKLKPKYFQSNRLETKHPLIIIDARPKLNAQANQAAGKGYEMGKGYENCRVLFMGIANIHVMRKSFDTLQELCCKWSNDDPYWFKNLETSGWLGHISRVLSASVRIVHCITIEEYSILVHCSDGWDRTAQLTSLPMLMMDPYYRTYDGFLILIEKEWFSFGHKFADRLGWTEDGWSDNERSPIFHQFLDCVYQCIRQQPNIFEFNENLLCFLATHVLSGWFGNTFVNCEQDKIKSDIMNTTVSIWTYIKLNRKEFTNIYYRLYPNIWVPNTSSRSIMLWKKWYLDWHNIVYNFSWQKKNEDFSEITDAPSKWMEDSSVRECCGCKKQFNFIRRRHHCRACGKIYCENCVKQTRIIANISEKTPVRCCNECISLMDIQDGERKDGNKRNPDSVTKSVTLNKRIGRPSAISIESIPHSTISSKRSSVRYRYGPSVSFDQYHPKISSNDNNNSNSNSNNTNNDNDNDNEIKNLLNELEDDDLSEILSNYSGSPKSTISPKSFQGNNDNNNISSSSLYDDSIDQIGIPNSFPFQNQFNRNYNQYETSIQDNELIEQDVSDPKRHSIKLVASSSLYNNNLPDRPRSTSFVPDNLSSLSGARTSIRFEKMKPNNPLALAVAVNKARMKKQGSNSTFGVNESNTIEE